uniref:Uncharacterized protein n=1 Tax=Desertifilum tharense IPPAS B-1220 TaxID=1781255 RepID=A0ACD5GSY7_9CYAN
MQATELRTDSALSSDSEHRCLVCKLRNSELCTLFPTQHSALYTQHSIPTRNSEYRYAEASYGTLH